MNSGSNDYIPLILVFTALVLSALGLHILYQWMQDHFDTVVKMIKWSVISLVTTAAVYFAMFFSLDLIPALVLILLAFRVTKNVVDDWSNKLKNLMVTLYHPSGKFKNVWIRHPEGDNVWCMSYDKNGKALLLRKVTLEKKEGHITVEFDTKTARLINWDGNMNAPESRHWEYVDNPGHGIPRDASFIQDVTF